MITTKLAQFAFAIIGISVCKAFSSLSTHHRHAHSSRRRYGLANGHRNDDRNFSRQRKGDCHATTTSSSLTMGIFDFIQENFLGSREGDFIPLEKSDGDTFGPGPLILMYAVPDSMDDEELKDMVEDGMPGRAREGVVIQRLSGMDMNGEGGDELLDSTVGEALNKAMTMNSSSSSGTSPLSTSARPIIVSSPENDPCPVLYFSGVSNKEMMDTYGIIADEIYQETNRVHWPACAKVVPPAMKKSMRRLLTEISGDHADAMNLRREEAEKTDESSDSDAK
mmetsp:Transcript_1761/g.3778  ORF Transcript_1761/g.3778 Transcript_1761/m.3778 type:complete len:280 (+) Transcript_1761:114-953(+)|eukprot:CAMPEP_0172312496 /NCGR_PEP_ID=MMETSP1058-20130122/17689_1 /TAXON_ID=83371 /ORGANISM="Detonula confervacea, Strain CCMP 353" /LENGTH=279 /DNA_ID=CAMNT_0013025975 /DNA_START=41 /DNA_END=880 /DNA_ORIENTATION=-